MKTIHMSGKRKKAVARATLHDGARGVHINHQSINVWSTPFAREKVREPLLVAGELPQIQVDINVIGGGPTSQAEASRVALARVLVGMDKKLEKKFLEYDRHLLVEDVRRKESRKPNRHGKARSKTQKSYR